jgi:hypothetical protein
MQVTTSANLVEYEKLEDGGSVTAVLPRQELESALEGDSPGLWFELGYDEEEAGRITIDLAPADIDEILRLSDGDEVVLALDRDWLSDAFDDSDVEAHGLRGALAIAVVAGAIAAPAGMAATPQAASPAAKPQGASAASVQSQVSRASVESQVTRQVTRQVAKGQVAQAGAKSQVAKSLVVKASGITKHRLNPR